MDIYAPRVGPSYQAVLPPCPKPLSRKRKNQSSVNRLRVKSHAPPAPTRPGERVFNDDGTIPDPACVWSPLQFNSSKVRGPSIRKRFRL